MDIFEATSSQNVSVTFHRLDLILIACQTFSLFLIQSLSFKVMISQLFWFKPKQTRFLQITSTNHRLPFAQDLSSQLKKSLTPYKQIIPNLHAFFTWKKQFYPLLIFAYITFIYLWVFLVCVNFDWLRLVSVQAPSWLVSEITMRSVEQVQQNVL